MNIETKIIEYLTEKGHKAYANVPRKRPETFVTVERTGGGFDSVIIDRPTVAVQMWAPSRLAASELAYAVRDNILKMNELVGISKVSLNALYNFPDADSGTNRYQAVFDFVTTEV